jgi:hypothetical protein
MSAAVGAAIEQGLLPASADDVAAKAAANAASDEAARAGSTLNPPRGQCRVDPAMTKESSNASLH